MKVLCVGVMSATSDNSKGIVLGGLQLLKVGFRYIWRPNCAGVFNDRKNYCFVCGQESLFLFAPRCGSESFKDFNGGICFSFSDFGVFAETKAWIQCEP